MRALVLSLVLGVATLGFMALTPSQAPAQEWHGNHDTYAVRWGGWRGGWGGWRGGWGGLRGGTYWRGGWGGWGGYYPSYGYGYYPYYGSYYYPGYSSYYSYPGYSSYYYSPYYYSPGVSYWGW
jgi:hypothetical protein